jgi:hypothetical protein
MPLSSPLPVAPSARGPRPPVPRRARSADYTDNDLDVICRWLLTGGLPAARVDRISQAIAELGVSRRGKIAERLERAFDQAQLGNDN